MGGPCPHVGYEGLLNLVALVARLQDARTVAHEEVAPSWPHPQVPPPTTLTAPLWDQLPRCNQQRLLWLLSQLLERQLPHRDEQKEAPDDPGE